MPRETITIGGNVWNVAKTKEEAVEDALSQGAVCTAKGCLTVKEQDEIVDLLQHLIDPDKVKFRQEAREHKFKVNTNG